MNSVVSSRSLRVPDSVVARQFFRHMHKLLALFVICWMLSGMFAFVLPYVPNFVRWGIFLVWFTSSVLHRKLFLKTFIRQSWPLLFLYCYILLISLFSEQHYVDVYLKSILYLIMIYSIFLYYFDSKYIKFQKVVVSFIFLDCVVLAINTYVQLQTHPMMARILATTPETMEANFGASVINGVGSYRYFYALVSIILLLGYCFLNFHKRRLLTLFTTIAFCIVLFKASFTIAIVLTFMFLVALITLRYTNKMTFIIVSTVGILLLVLFKTSLVSLFLQLSIADGISNELSTRFTEIAFFLSGDNVSGTDLQTRGQLYKQSVDGFLNNFLFGTSVSNTQRYIAGGHSAWFDSLCYFGLMFILLFIFMFKAYKYVIAKLPVNFKSFVTVYWLYFISVGAINTLFFANIFTTWLLFLPFAINVFAKREAI